MLRSNRQFRKLYHAPLGNKELIRPICFDALIPASGNGSRKDFQEKVL